MSNPVKFVAVDPDWLEGIMQRAERSAEREEKLLAEIKALREREPMTRQMIANELGIKPDSVDYYYEKGLLTKRVGRIICICTRGEFERWCATTDINFRKKQKLTR